MKKLIDYSLKVRNKLYNILLNYFIYFLYFKLNIILYKIVQKFYINKLSNMIIIEIILIKSFKLFSLFFLKNFRNINKI